MVPRWGRLILPRDLTPCRDDRRHAAHDRFVHAVVRPIASIVTVEAATVSDAGLHLMIPASFGRVQAAHISFDQHHYLPITARHADGREMVFDAAPSLRKAYRAFSAGRPRKSGTCPQDHPGPPLVACSLVKLATPVRTLSERGAVVELALPLVAGEHVLFEVDDSVALKAVVSRVTGYQAELAFDRLERSKTWAAREG